MSRSERVAQNQEVFRQANEILADVAEPAADSERWFPFICECADLGCMGELPLSLDEYRHIRGRPDHYAILPGHEATDIERVVERGNRFAIVEKG